MWTSHILLLSLIFLLFGQFCKYRIQVWGSVKNGNKRVNSVFFPERGPWGWVGEVVSVRWGSMSITFSKLPSASCTVCCNDCNRLHLCGFASTLLSFSSSPFFSFLALSLQGEILEEASGGRGRGGEFGCLQNVSL